jgi:hypothetical protein
VNLRPEPELEGLTAPGSRDPAAVPRGAPAKKGGGGRRAELAVKGLVALIIMCYCGAEVGLRTAAHPLCTRLAGVLGAPRSLAPPMRGPRRRSAPGCRPSPSPPPPPTRPGARLQGSLASSLCTSAHPLHVRFANIFRCSLLFRERRCDRTLVGALLASIFWGCFTGGRSHRAMESLSAHSIGACPITAMAVSYTPLGTS